MKRLLFALAFAAGAAHAGPFAIGEGNFTITTIAVPGGADTQVQFDDGGLFAGDATFIFNKTTKLLTASLISATTGFRVNGAATIKHVLRGDGTNFVDAALACADLSNGATGCSTATGTSGATIPLLNGTNTWSGVNTFPTNNTTGYTVATLPTGVTGARTFVTNTVACTFLGALVDAGGGGVFCPVIYNGSAWVGG
jgi:hypothetical protein